MTDQELNALNEKLLELQQREPERALEIAEQIIASSNGYRTHLPRAIVVRTAFLRRANRIDPTNARTEYERARAIAHEIQDDATEAYALITQGTMERYIGNLDEARHL